MNSEIVSEIRRVLQSSQNEQLELQELIISVSNCGYDRQAILRTIRELMKMGKVSFSKNYAISGHGKVYTTGLVKNENKI